jgi:hypothetical protein
MATPNSSILLAAKAFANSTEKGTYCCASMVTMITGTRQNVTSYVCCLPCYFPFSRNVCRRRWWVCRMFAYIV